MARWYGLTIERKPIGGMFEAPDRKTAERLAPAGSWEVMSVLEFEDRVREAEAKERADARKLRLALA